MAPENVFSTRTEQNTSGIIVCLVHLEQYLVSETKYLYAADGRFRIEQLDRGYRYSCIKHYLKKMVQNCRYEVFNNE